MNCYIGKKSKTHNSYFHKDDFLIIVILTLSLNKDSKLFRLIFKDQKFSRFQLKRTNLDLKILRTQTFKIVLSVRPGDLVKI